MELTYGICWHCGGPDYPGHPCDGRQGRVEASIIPGATEPVRFDGETYEPEFDESRLKGQLCRVYTAMVDGQYRTFNEISDITGDPHASISARLRDLRKPRFGSHTVERRHRGDRTNGLWEYRLVVNKG